MADKKRLSPAIKLALFHGPLVVLLLLLSASCFRWALADIYATQVKYQLEKDDDTDIKKSVKAWRQAEQQLQQSLALRPDNAEYLEIAENFYQALDTLETDKPILLQELGFQDNEQKALQYGRQALLLRPSWSYLWGELAITKIALNQFDNEQTSAFQRALTLGPWEQSINYSIALMGLENWENLKNESKYLIPQAIDQSLNMNQIEPYEENLQSLLTHDNVVQACALINSLNSGSFTTLSAHCQDHLAKQKTDRDTNK